MSAIPHAALWQTVPVLRGKHVMLVPLARGHVGDLIAVRDDAGLDGLWFTNTPGRDEVGDYVEAALQAHAEGKALPFAVLDAGGKVAGTTRFYNLDAGVPKLSIGYTWYAPRVQRSGLNTEAKLLLLNHAFAMLGCIRVEFETSSQNARSRAAIARLGATQEGLLRNHKRHADGTPRDTVVFSIIDGDWPQVKAGLLQKLHSREVSA